MTALSIFSARLTMSVRAIAKDHSVCLSVCPSVIFVIQAYTVQDIEIDIAPYDRAMFRILGLKVYR